MRQKKRLKKLNKILFRIKMFQEQMKEWTDEKLACSTVEFKERLDKGETLDEILPEADRKILA